MADDDFVDAVAHLKEGKFVHLLKPIRDLAENWNVDIANELEEYLTHLDRTCFSFDDGPSLDFAEAALLIQSSACVYSKKVEYLHTLVYQALEAVRTKRRKDGKDGEERDGMGDGMLDDTQQTGRAAAKSQRRQQAQEEDDSLEAFLACGEDLVECRDIDMDEDTEAVAPAYVRIPAALLTLEEQGSRQQGDGDAGVYRLACCSVHVSGALLLDPNDGRRYDAQLGPAKQYDDRQQRLGAGQAAAATQQQQLPVAQPAELALQKGQDSKGDDDDDDNGGGMAGGGGDEDEDGDGDCNMADAAAPAAAAAPQLPAELQLAAAPAAPVAGEGEGGQGDLTQGRDQATAVAAAPLEPQLPPARAARGKGTGDNGGGETEGGEAEPEFFDPFQPLDPQDPGSLPIKPMQVRKPSQARKAACLARKNAPGRQAGFGFGSEAGAGGLVPALTFQEFGYAAELLLPRQRGAGGARTAAAMLQQQQQEGRGVVPEAAAPPPAWGGRVEGGAAEEGEEGGPWEDEGPAGFGEDDGGQDDAGGGGAGAEDEGWATLGAADVMAGMEGMQLRHLELSALGDDDGGAGAGSQSYEELCRSHMETMLASASARQVVTELAQRVTDWRTRIDPVLRAEETRRPFDLQMYGEKILEKLLDENKGAEAPAAAAPALLEFRVIAHATDRSEVSRTFAAMLQLINNRNVSLCQVGGPDAPFRLQLLTAVQPHKRMADKLAARGTGGYGAGLPAGAAALPEGGTEEGVEDGEEGVEEEGVENVGGSWAAGAGAAGKGGSGIRGGKGAGGGQEEVKVPRPRAKKARA